MIQIMQGDQYDLPVAISHTGGDPIDAASVEKVEITVGPIIKTYPGEVVFSGENNRWLFPLSQNETIDLPPLQHPVQVRVKFVSGNVVGTNAGVLCVNAVRSKEVL